VAVCAAADEFVNVCVIEFPDPAAAPVSVPALVLAVHVNVVPARSLVNTIPVVVPEHIVPEAGVAVATGKGLTVITTVTGVPGHPFAVGVIV
jgi:hypothetical protein